MKRVTAKNQERSSSTKERSRKNRSSVPVVQKESDFHVDSLAWVVKEKERPIGYNNSKAFRFIDLFCGIGGFHRAFEKQGGTCVFASDWDKYSQITYRTNFPDTPLVGDITQVPVDTIPQHDVLCAGFPCQPFSLAGVSKKNSLETFV